jgi:hypothetical protein
MTEALKTEIPRCTASGEMPVNPNDAPTPTSVTRPDGQKADHWVMCPTEIIQAGFKRPIRLKYRHVGLAGPKYPLSDLTPEQKRLWGDDCGVIKFEAYPAGSHGNGRVWLQADLDRIDKGCGTVTSMPRPIAETYAANPGYYGSTFCCGCGKYLPVGAKGEFVWDGTNDRVGT